MRSRRLVLCAVAVVSVGAILLTGGCGRKSPKAGDRIAAVKVPTTPPPNSITMLVPKPHGDPDAKFYGAGFIAALGEKMLCPGTSLVLQARPHEGARRPKTERTDQRKLLSREEALKAGKTAGVRYVLTGDARLVGDSISISAEMLDVTTGSTHAKLKTSGRLSGLPAMQVDMVRQVVRAMGLKPNAEQSRVLGTPSFAKPATLLLSGKSYLADGDEGRKFAWKALEADPDSSLAAKNVLFEYAGTQGKYQELRRDKRLWNRVMSAGRRFPNDPSTNVAIAGMHARQYEFKKAESLVRSIVEKDPGFDYARSALQYTAEWRMNADLAVSEGRLRVEAWPTNSYAHASLAEAYLLTARNARRGHPVRELTRAKRRAWRSNTLAAFDEAAVAVRLDPDDARAWYAIMMASLDLEWPEYADRGFRQMVRIDTKDVRPYRDYAYCIARDSGASKRLDEVLALADRNLGAGSARACIVRGWVALADSDAKRAEEALSLADKALSKSGKSDEPRSAALELKAYALRNLDRPEEMLKVAEEGFALDPSPRWRLTMSGALIGASSESRDKAMIKRAIELLSIYVDEIPFDPYGHAFLGRCLGRLNLEDMAGKQYAWALALDPSDRYSKKMLSRTRPGPLSWF